jgi:hypothetical protein
MVLGLNNFDLIRNSNYTLQCNCGWSLTQVGFCEHIKFKDARKIIVKKH